MYTLRLFCKTIKCRFLALTEYPGAYIAGMTAQWTSYSVDMIMLFLIVWNFGSLAGWIPDEIIFIYAIWLMTYAIGASFTYNVCMQFPQMAISGTLDEAYIRPVRPLIYLIASNFNLGYISHLVLTTCALGFSIARLGLSWAYWQWGWLLIIILAGSIIQGCMFLIFHMPGLRTYTRSPIATVFNEGRQFTQYPITIYPKPLQLIFMSVLPFAFVNFYPAQVLLGKYDGLLPRVNMWLSPIVSILVIGITMICWKFVTSRYESAGT